MKTSFQLNLRHALKIFNSLPMESPEKSEPAVAYEIFKRSLGLEHSLDSMKIDSRMKVLLISSMMKSSCPQLWQCVQPETPIERIYKCTIKFGVIEEDPFYLDWGFLKLYKCDYANNFYDEGTFCDLNFRQSMLETGYSKLWILPLCLIITYCVCKMLKLQLSVLWDKLKYILTLSILLLFQWIVIMIIATTGALGIFYLGLNPFEVISIQFYLDLIIQCVMGFYLTYLLICLLIRNFVTDMKTAFYFVIMIICFSLIPKCSAQIIAHFGQAML